MITFIHNTGGNLKVWDQVAEAKDVFSKIRMVKIESPQLKKLAQYYADVGGGSPVLHTCLYRAIKLTFATDVGGIVLEGRITPDMEIWDNPSGS